MFECGVAEWRRIEVEARELRCTSTFTRDYKHFIIALLIFILLDTKLKNTSEIYISLQEIGHSFGKTM